MQTADARTVRMYSLFQGSRGLLEELRRPKLPDFSARRRGGPEIACSAGTPDMNFFRNLTALNTEGRPRWTRTFRHRRQPVVCTALSECEQVRQMRVRWHGVTRFALPAGRKSKPVRRDCCAKYARTIRPGEVSQLCSDVPMDDSLPATLRVAGASPPSSCLQEAVLFRDLLQWIVVVSAISEPNPCARARLEAARSIRRFHR